jgi:uncharacterized protein YcfJ
LGCLKQTVTLQHLVAILRWSRILCPGNLLLPEHLFCHNMNKLTLGFLVFLSGAASAQQYPGTASAQGYPPGAYPPPPPPGQTAYQSNAVPRFTVPVVSSTPAYQTQMREHKVCDKPAPSTGTNAVGTILGGVAGGLLGHQVGRGTGRTVATAAGAVGGAVAGNAIANNMEETPSCRMVTDPQQVLVGYDVIYEFSGQRGQVRLPQQPGSSIVVEVRPAGM